MKNNKAVISAIISSLSLAAVSGDAHALINLNTKSSNANDLVNLSVQHEILQSKKSVSSLYSQRHQLNQNLTINNQSIDLALVTNSAGTAADDVVQISIKENSDDSATVGVLQKAVYKDGNCYDNCYDDCHSSRSWR